MERGGKLPMAAGGGGSRRSHSETWARRTQTLRQLGWAHSPCIQMARLVWVQEMADECVIYSTACGSFEKQVREIGGLERAHG